MKVTTREKAVGLLKKWPGTPYVMSVMPVGTFIIYQKLEMVESSWWAAPARVGGTVRQGRRYGPSGQAVRSVRAGGTIRQGGRYGPSWQALRSVRAGGTFRQGRRYSPSGQAIRAVQHGTNHARWATPYQLKWAGHPDLLQLAPVQMFKDDICVGLVLFIALFSNKKRPLGVLAKGSYILSMGSLFTVLSPYNKRHNFFHHFKI
jgi:hypothetical protein